MRMLNLMSARLHETSSRSRRKQCIGYIRWPLLSAAWKIYVRWEFSWYDTIWYDRTHKGTSLVDCSLLRPQRGSWVEIQLWKLMWVNLRGVLKKSEHSEKGVQGTYIFSPSYNCEDEIEEDERKIRLARKRPIWSIIVLLFRRWDEIRWDGIEERYEEKTCYSAKVNTKTKGKQLTRKRYKRTERYHLEQAWVMCVGRKEKEKSG